MAQLPTTPPAAAASSPWTRLDDAIFESAILLFPKGTKDRWQTIAFYFFPDRSPEDMKECYEALLRDIALIESGLVELPRYPDDHDLVAEELHAGELTAAAETEVNGGAVSEAATTGVRTKRILPAKRKKGLPWTIEEHRLFLDGLQKYGDGDWRSISKYCVVTRTPAQVASHNQKYRLRQSVPMAERKRTSIHDVVPQP